MNKTPISSRNRLTIHSEYTICPQCKKRVYYSSLNSSKGEIEYFSKNTIIITCPHCMESFIPDVSHYYEYVYNNKNKRKDGK